MNVSLTKPETTYQAVGTIRPENVAKKLEAIRNHEYPDTIAQLIANPRLAELLWFLQYMSMQAGGLVKFCADLVEQLPERFGTKTMRTAKRLEYTLEEKRGIYGEFPHRYNPVPMSDPDQESWEDVFLAARADYAPADEEDRACQRREFEKYLKSWTAAEMRKIVLTAAAEILPRYLEDLCTQRDKGFTEPLGPKYLESPYWFMDDPVAAVFEMMDRRVKEVSKRLAMTAVAKQVFDALDYALQEKAMVRIEGDSRFGKSESVKAWAAMRPGLARVVTVPSSNSVAGLLRRVSEALGIPFTYGTQAQVLRERIEYVLRQSSMFLILDESAFLIPQSYTATTAPGRLNWVRTEIVDRGLPLALVHTPQTFLPATDKFVKKTGFAMQQFFGRIYRAVQLPSELERADLIAVARIHFPEMGDDYLEVVGDLAELSENYLQTVEAVAKLARFIARREGHRRVTISDIEAAAGEIIPRQATPAPDSSLSAGRQPGTRRAPAQAAERAVQPSGMQPSVKRNTPRFSTRGAALEVAETDLVQVET
jgi:hypothetical protein